MAGLITKCFKYQTIPTRLVGRMISKHGVRSESSSSSALIKYETVYQPGDRIHGYTVKQITPVPELNLTAIHLDHDVTGADHLHIAKEDQNNVFMVAFRTTPMDSTGVPHILEHTVLCGSQMFPCRDPFFKMLNRSQSTFMNAMTGCDYTMYPFSTLNKKDFENLMRVYLDAAFFPHLRETDFRQEGWRLEQTDLTDAQSSIIFKGVVYNEMKGALSDPESLYMTHLLNKLMPGHTYAVISGGDPANIPDLTWAQLKEFHASHYHPSNSRFYTYGNFPMESHLSLINELILEKFPKIQPDTAVPTESRWTEPRRAHVTCMSDQMAPNPDRQGTVSVTYLLGSVTDTYEQFAMSILCSLMVSGPKAPFYKSLIDTNIGSSYSPGTGFDNSTRESLFSVGLQGLHSDDIERVLCIIDDTYKNIVRDGFESERIEAVLHSIELSQKHQTTNFGLNLAMALTPIRNHGGDPLEPLQVNDNVERFRLNLAENTHYLQDMVKQHFINNKHRLTLSMSPDSNFEQEQTTKENTKLEEKTKLLTEDDRREIYERGIELAELQSQQQDLSCLPTLLVSDIDRNIKHTTVSNEIIAGIPVQLCAQPTSGVTYFRGLLHINDLESSLRPYIPLFTDILTRMGTETYSYQELSQRIALTTGGLSTMTSLSQSHSSLYKYEQGIQIASYCLDRNIEHMFDLLQDVFNKVDITNVERLTTLVKQSAASLSNSVAQSGHMYAMLSAGSSIAPTAQLKEEFGGMTQVLLMKSIAERSDMTPVLAYLKAISETLLNKKYFRCSVNALPEHIDTVKGHMNTMFSNLCGDEPASNTLPSLVDTEKYFQSTSQSIHYELPLPVNYISEAVAVPPYTHPDYASLRILARLMSAKFLHREIREKGGAYGSGANLSGAGVFSFFSYRDPNTERTLEAFQSSTDWAVNGEFKHEDIDEAKLPVFAGVDSPVAPGNKGLALFLEGITDEMRQQHRDEMFAVDRDSLVDVAQRYLKGALIKSTTLIGPENQLTKNNESWTVKSMGV